MNRADVTAPLVDPPHAPVEPHDLIAYWVDVVRRVEVLQLVRQQLSDVEENKAADSE